MEQKSQSRVLDMTCGSALPLLLRFAMPLFCGNLLQQFYNLADTSLAGHILGDAALSQIGATAALYSLITNFAFGLNNGLALTVSRFFGAGENLQLARNDRQNSFCPLPCTLGGVYRRVYLRAGHLGGLPFVHSGCRLFMPERLSRSARLTFAIFFSL